MMFKESVKYCPLCGKVLTDSKCDSCGVRLVYASINVMEGSIHKLISIEFVRNESVK